MMMCRNYVKWFGSLGFVYKASRKYACRTVCTVSWLLSRLQRTAQTFRRNVSFGRENQQNSMHSILPFDLWCFGEEMGRDAIFQIIENSVSLHSKSTNRALLRWPQNIDQNICPTPVSFTHSLVSATATNNLMIHRK